MEPIVDACEADKKVPRHSAEWQLAVGNWDICGEQKFFLVNVIKQNKIQSRILLNDNEHNDIQHNDTQQNGTLHNDT